MIHEKIFQLKSGREVKVIIKGYHLHDNPQLSTEYEILIREPKEKYFREPIGINHPQYWKMKRISPQQAKTVLLEYSGISQRQLSLAISEFNKLANHTPLVAETQYTAQVA
ncbi:hypothetical protein [Dyadobacter sandarakinus]|uniref:Uncharacterized protein n=1 Tax=Dyadobacter sandarakinus TaxID=2747268 RepID=A0ABX7I7C2_9BACT|nr:hypothetical protein [Dyadobacter sandarakinus]QRR02004.1 hypothetical protein HWI92_14345 [Dyadobacter sandarakinus]